MTALLFRIVAGSVVLFVVYVIARASGWTFAHFGPDARAQHDAYTESANRALVRARIEQLIEQTKTRPAPKR